jgi:CMP-N,N'-diacetyllegionaminic acid synthase
MKRLCTICARGGSKGVPNKNIRPFLGKPLLTYSIAQARESGLFERIAVSSDSTEILKLAEASGVDDVIQRPAEMATDHAAKVSAIHHALTTIEQRYLTAYDILVDLAVTSPLRRPDDICGAVRLLEESGATSVITGAPSRRSPYFSLVEKFPDGRIDLSKRGPSEFVRRQDAPPTFDMDGSIYVWAVSKFRVDPKVFYTDTRLFEVPVERAHDIDSELDFVIAEFLMRRHGVEAS